MESVDALRCQTAVGALGWVLSVTRVASLLNTLPAAMVSEQYDL